MAGEVMKYRGSRGMCDFKMMEIFPDHTHADYYFTLAVISIPLMASWVIIVVGNIIVAYKLFTWSGKRAKCSVGSLVAKSIVISTAVTLKGADSKTVDNKVQSPDSKSEDKIRRSKIFDVDPASKMKKRPTIRRQLRRSMSSLTLVEAAMIKCTVALSLNYMIIHSIFIIQIFGYVFKPDISVFNLIARSSDGMVYSVMWYYMAMPLTGFINTVMLVRYNRNLRRTLFRMVAKRSCA